VGEVWRQSARISPGFAGRNLATAGSLVGARGNKPSARGSKPSAEERFSHPARVLLLNHYKYASKSEN
ncbi:hypothetical protein A2U01_0084263, partial [Trifolium medium]|nr:hypothetical protein [Trifolium medium]